MKKLFITKSIGIIVLCFFSSFSLLKSQTLGGTYTIGGNGADFASISAACNAISNYGMSSAVVFEVSGTFYENVTIKNWNDLRSKFPVSFKSYSAVIIGDDPTATVQIENSSNISFGFYDPYGFEIRNTENGSAISIKRNSNDCYIPAGGFHAANNAVIKVSDVSRFSIKDSYTIGGSCGISLSNVNQYNIENCAIYEFKEKGIYVSNWGVGNTCNIKKKLDRI